MVALPLRREVELFRLQETIEIFKNKNNVVNDEQPEYLVEAWKAVILKNTKGTVRVQEHPQSHPMEDRMEQPEESLVKQPIRNTEICASNDCIGQVIIHQPDVIPEKLGIALI